MGTTYDPQFRYHDYEAELGSRSPIAEVEWRDFLNRRKMLLDTIMNESSNYLDSTRRGQAAQTVDAFGNPLQGQPMMQQGHPMQPPVMSSSQEDLIAQARAWNIPNPEQIPPQQLAYMIQQKRGEFPRDQQADAGSRALMLLGGAAEAGSATERLIGNLFGAVHELPFAGPVLSNILGTEKAKRWMYDMSMGAEQFIEDVRKAQPSEDKTTNDVVLGTGKLIGFALPAIAAWEAVGAAGGAVPASWASQVTNPIFRAALQGGLSATALEVGSNEPTKTKVFNIGLGTIMGGVQPISRLAAPVLGATVGAGIGGSVGDTPEDRQRHAIEGGIAGAIAGSLPGFIAATQKIRTDMPGPFDQSVNAAVESRQVDPRRLIQGGIQRASATMAEPPVDTGPDYVVHSDDAVLGAGQPQASAENRNLPVKPEGLRAAAWQASDGTVFEGPSHWQAMEKAQAAGYQPLDLLDGFTTDKGAFVDRVHAGMLDEMAGNVSPTGEPLHTNNYGGESWVGAVHSESIVPESFIKPLTLENAGPSADAISRQNIILESTSLPGALQRTKVGDLDVVDAGLVNNPAGATLVRGLSKPLDILNSPYAGQVKFVQRGNGFDALVGNVSDQQVAEYGKYGVFSGQTVVTGDGTEGSVLKIMPNAGMAVIQTASGRTLMAKPEDILPSRYGTPQVAVPEMWDQFKTDLIQYVHNESRRAGMTPVALVDRSTTELSAGPAVHTFTFHAGGTGNVDVTAQRFGDTIRIFDISHQRGSNAIGPSKLRDIGASILKEFPGATKIAGVRVSGARVEGLDAMQQDALLHTAVDDSAYEYADPQFIAEYNALTDPRVTSVMQPQMSEFFDKLGIQDHAQRQLLEADFNRRWVQDVRGMDPEMASIQDDALTAAHEAQSEVASADHSPVTSLEEKADRRGFIWVSRPGEGGILKDGANPNAPDVPVENDQAAHEFLARIDRHLPDLSPASDVPIEVMQMAPKDTRFDPRLDTESRSESLERVVAAGNLSDVGVGGAGGGGSLPPSGAGFSSGGALPPGRRSTLGGQFQHLRRTDPLKLAALENEFQGLLSNKIRYTRYATLGLETKLKDLGVDLGRAWGHYDALDAARHEAVNEGLPWINEWSGIMKQFPRRALRDGSVTRIHEIEDPNARAAAWYRMKDSHGMSDQQIKAAIAADDQITSFMHRFFEFTSGDPAFALTADREIFRYMPHVRARQAQDTPDPFSASWLNPATEFFAEFAREGNLQFRVMDARDLGTHLVRAAMFKKYEAGPWEDLVSAWQDPRVPRPFQDYMMDYARLSRYGYDPRGDLAVRGVQSMFSRVLRTPISSHEAQHLLNIPIGFQYMSMLAGRASIFFRDAIQPLLALAKVKMPYMADVYGDVLAGAGQKITRQQHNTLSDMYQRGLDGGWIERENPNLEAAGMFEEPPGELEEEVGLTKEEAGRRELLARIGDKAYHLPNWLVRPTESNISTLKWYGKQGQLHRLIVGESAYRQAMDGLTAYRQSQIASVIARDPSIEIPYEKMAEGTFFSSFEPPIQRKLQELVNNGADQEAATVFARQVANWSQFKYGRKEMPPLFRNTFGRVVASLGSFTGQFLEAMNSSLANGTFKQRVRAAMTVGTISGLLYEAKHLTGWSFDRWAWVPQVFQYAGGPLVEPMATAAVGAAGALSSSEGRKASQVETAAMKDMMGGPNPLNYFPYTGYIKSLSEYYAAAHGTNPLEQMARYTVTGDHGTGMDMGQVLDDYAKQNMTPNPRGSLSPNGGLPPGMGGDSYHPPHIQPPHPQAPDADPRDTAQINQLFHEANAMLGTPFKLGGRDIRTGLDCAEFIRQAYAKIGYKLPEGTSGLASVGQPVKSFDDIRPGDILLFDVEHWDQQGVDHPGSDFIPDHSAIYAGNGKIIHDTSSGNGVRYDELDSPYGKLIMSGLHSVRRIISNGDPNAVYFDQASYHPREGVPNDLANQMTEIFPQMPNRYMRENAITTSRQSNSNGTGFIQQNGQTGNNPGAGFMQ